MSTNAACENVQGFFYLYEQSSLNIRARYRICYKTEKLLSLVYTCGKVLDRPSFREYHESIKERISMETAQEFLTSFVREIIKHPMERQQLIASRAKDLEAREESIRQEAVQMPNGIEPLSVDRIKLKVKI